MIIIGVDFHPEFQQIASVNTDTGEFQEKRLAHPEEAEKFYRALAGAEESACGHGGQWARTLVRTTAWPSCSLSCGSETQPRSVRSGCGSRRRIARMRS